MNKNIVTICMLSLLVLLSCDMNLLDKLIGTVSEKFSEEAYYAGLLRRRQEQSDVALKFGKRFKKKSRNRRESIDLTGGGGTLGYNNNITENIKDLQEDVKDLQSLSSQAKASAVVLTQKPQQNVENLVIPKLIEPATDILKLAKSSDLESLKKSSEDSERNVEVGQQKHEHKILAEPTENVIESQSYDASQSESDASQSSDVLIREEKEKKEHELAVQEAKIQAIKEVKSEIDSALQSIGMLNKNLSEKLLELEELKSKIFKARSKVEKVDINVRQIVAKIVTEIRTGNTLSVEQILDQSGKKTQDSINVAKALYQNQIDMLKKVKVSAEAAKNSIDFSSDISKEKDILKSVNDVIESLYNDSSSRTARSKAKKDHNIFEDLIMRLEKFDSIIKAGSYDNLDDKLKFNDKDLKKNRQDFQIMTTNKNDEKALLYNKLKTDAERSIKKLLNDNVKYFLSS